MGINDPIDEITHCYFHHPGIKPTTLYMPIPPNGVHWEYNMNTSITDTYGGQVVQLLSVNIMNVEINGVFGHAGYWGWTAHEPKKIDQPVPRSPHGRSEALTWKNQNNGINNGIRQMADWFREYFQISTQGNKKGEHFQNYNQQAMTFGFPGRGWKFLIRPKSFPSVVMSNEIVGPEWKVEADFVEDKEVFKTFIRDVSQLARKRLNSIEDGIGYSARNPFSQYINTKEMNKTRGELADLVIESYQGSVDQGLSEEELDTIVKYGFSFPGRVLEMAGLLEEEGTGSNG